MHLIRHHEFVISGEKTMIDRTKLLALAAVMALSAGGLAACSG